MLPIISKNNVGVFFVKLLLVALVSLLTSLKMYAEDNEFNEFEKEMDKIAEQYSSSDQQVLLEKLDGLKSRADYQDQNVALLLLYECYVFSLTDKVKASQIADELKSYSVNVSITDFYASYLKCGIYASEKPSDDISNRELNYRSWDAVKQAKSATIRYWISVGYAFDALRSGRHDQAIQAATMAFDVANANNHARRIYTSIGVLALIQSEIGEYEEALKSNEIALSYASSDDGRQSLLVNRGYIYLKVNDLDNSKRVYGEALALIEKSGDRQSEVAVKLNLAEIYERQNRTIESESLIKYCAELSKKIGYDEGVAFSKMFLAKFKLYNANLDEAISLFTEAENWFIEVGDNSALLDHTKAFSENLNEKGYFKQAYQYLSKATQLADEIQKTSRQSDAMFYSATFESERKDREIQQLNGEVEKKNYEMALQSLSRQRWLAFLLALACTFAAVVFAYLHLRRRHSRLETLSKELDYHSSHDALTGANNRRYVEKFLNAYDSLQKELRGKESLLLILCDIDFFKKINDTYGHDAGDQVLKEVCVRLKTHLRNGDVISRWGGEEFLLLVRFTEDVFVEALVKRLLEALSMTPVNIGESVIKISMSMGYCRFNCGQDSWDDSLKVVDRFLYLSKTSGRNQAWGCVNRGATELMSISTESLSLSCQNIR